MILLAESSWTAPTGLASVVAILFFIAAGINQMFKLKRNVSPDGNPPNASLDLRVVNVERRVDSVEKKADQAHTDLRALEQRIISNGDVRKKEIEGKVEATRLELKEDIAAVRSDLQDQTNELLRAIGRIEGKESK